CSLPGHDVRNFDITNCSPSAQHPRSLLTTDNGPRTTDHGLRTTDHGQLSTSATLLPPFPKLQSFSSDKTEWSRRDRHWLDGHSCPSSTRFAKERNHGPGGHRPARSFEQFRPGWAGGG